MICGWVHVWPRPALPRRRRVTAVRRLRRYAGHRGLETGRRRVPRRISVGVALLVVLFLFLVLARVRIPVLVLAPVPVPRLDLGRVQVRVLVMVVLVVPRGTDRGLSAAW